MYFSNKIIELRKKNGLSLEEAAGLLHFSTDELALLETGEREASASELKALANLYKVSVDKLLDTKDKVVKHKKKETYKITKRRLVGFNRYGMKQGVSVVTIPIMAFIALCLMFTPGFAVPGQTVSLMKLMFLTNYLGYTILGSFIILMLSFIIIYWAVELTLGNYFRARMKYANNVILAIMAVFTFSITLTAVLIFHNVLAGGIVTYIMLFAVALVQIIFLIIMNLEGGDFGSEQVYIYHECDYSGYEKKQWFTLGLSVLSIAAFSMMFVTAYKGRPNFLTEINATMFQIFFNATNIIGIFIGGLCFAILAFNMVYWILLCTLPRIARRKLNTANNLLLVIMNIILFVDTVAAMSFFGVEYLTPVGCVIYALLFVTAIYGLVIIPIINCNKKSMYVEDENGLHKIQRVQGQKPGRIMAYKFSAIPQYIMLALLVVLTGVAFTSAKIHFVGYFGVPAFILEAIFLCFQHNGKYVNIPVFAYGMIVNTIIGLFNGFLLAYSIFTSLGGVAAIAIPIVSASIVIVYVWITFFLKPIRDASSEIK